MNVVVALSFSANLWVSRVWFASVVKDNGSFYDLC